MPSASERLRLLLPASEAGLIAARKCAIVAAARTLFNIRPARALPMPPNVGVNFALPQAACGVAKRRPGFCWTCRPGSLE